MTTYFADGIPLPTEPSTAPGALKTTPLSEVVPLTAERVTTLASLPIWAAQLCAIVGEGESGKTWIAVHAVADVAARSHHVLVVDGEMSASSWRNRFRSLDIPAEVLTRVHYAEMTDTAADVDLVRNTVTALGIRLVVWDSALSMLSRTARSENDNAEVARVYDRLREIVRNGPAGLIVDHTTRGANNLVSRGATAKFNALDISYGVKLADGSVPGQAADWYSTVSVEKDRHGLLGARTDREVLFHPLGSGHLHIEITETAGATHRLTADRPPPISAALSKIAALHPPPTSANDADNRLGGTRTVNLAAYKAWKAQHSE